MNKEELNKETAQSPRGRAGVVEKWKAANPGATANPSEDELWQTAQEGYEGLKGKYNAMESGQQGLTDYVSKDPRFGAAIGMSFGEGEGKVPFTQALGRLYGPEVFNDDENFANGIAEYNEAQAQSKKEQAEAQKNFAESMKRFDAFIKQNQLDEETKSRITDEMFSLADGFLQGNIPNAIFDLIHKGISYDQDVQEAADTGFVEGKNEKVRADMKRKTTPGAIPDMGSTTAGLMQRRMPEAKNQSFSQMLEDVE